MKGQQISDDIQLRDLSGFKDPTMTSGEETQSLLAMAQLYGRLRAKKGIWQMLVYELLELNQVNINKIAHEVGVSSRTIKRILSSHTQQPSIKTSFKLFFMHSKLRRDRYRVLENGAVEIDTH